MNDRLPLEGLAEMDIVAAVRKQRHAHANLRKAMREADMADQEVARCEEHANLRRTARGVS